MNNLTEIKKQEIYDNIGRLRNVYFLPIGTKLRAKVNKTSTGDVGCSGLTFKYDAFKVGDIYEVSYNTVWDFKSISYLKDTDGTLHFAEVEMFDVVN